MIKEFQGRNRFLSNFIQCRISLDKGEYPTVEHAYQASKTMIPAERAFIRTAVSPGQAKIRGRRATLRVDWEDVKIPIMKSLVEQKFTRHPDLKKRLLATENQVLQEGNRWNDTFWGVNLITELGSNHLGRILMDVRKKLKEEGG